MNTFLFLKSKISNRNTRARAHTHTLTRTRTHARTHSRKDTHTHTRTHSLKDTHTHTHTHTHTQSSDKRNSGKGKLAHSKDCASMPRCLITNNNVTLSGRFQVPRRQISTATISVHGPSHSVLSVSSNYSYRSWVSCAISLPSPQRGGQFHYGKERVV